MEAATTGTNRLHIGCFRCDYLVPAAHPDPNRLRRRLDAALEKRLPEVLRATLRSWFSNSDESVWLIRRLDVPIVLSTGWSSDDSARRFAGEVSRVLAQAVAAGGEDVLRFSSRASYLSQFLIDLAAGHAWGAWYYESFSGLRMLPVSAALRTAICEDTGTGLAALLDLSERALTGVLDALTPRDARHVLNDLATTAGGDDPTAEFDRLVSAWLELGIEISSTDQEPNEALRLYLEVCRRGAHSGSSSLRTMAQALVRLANRFGESPENEPVFAALAAGDTPALYAMGSGSDVLFPLLRVAPGRVKAANRALRRRRSGADASAAQRFTPFGGLFLLLPILDAMPIDEATADWPDLGGTQAPDLIRFLILVKCFGRRNAKRMFSDPVARDLMKVAPSLRWEDVREWLSRRRNARLDHFLASLVRWQRDRGAIGGDDLAVVRAPLPGAAAGIVVDRRRGVWVFATSDVPHRPLLLVERVRSGLARVGLTPERLAVDPSFGELVRGGLRRQAAERAEQPEGRDSAGDGLGDAASNGRIDSAGDGLGDAASNGLVDAVFDGSIEAAAGNRRADAASGDRPVDAAIDAAAGNRADANPPGGPHAASDLKELVHPVELRGARSADLALSVAAQQVLLAFAWRLPGFAASSQPYLLANFLDVPGVMDEEPERRVVRLGQPPLQFVLSATGMARSTYRISRLDDRPFVLFQERY